jgi:hypothetical protein
MSPGVLLVLWLLFGSKSSSAPAPGQGGVKTEKTLRGLDGRTWHVTIFNDTTRLAETDKVSFFASEDGKVIKVLKGSSAEMADAVANLPE